MSAKAKTLFAQGLAAFAVRGASNVAANLSRPGAFKNVASVGLAVILGLVKAAGNDEHEPLGALAADAILMHKGTLDTVCAVFDISLGLPTDKADLMRMKKGAVTNALVSFADELALAKVRFADSMQTSPEEKTRVLEEAAGRAAAHADLIKKLSTNRGTNALPTNTPERNAEVSVVTESANAAILAGTDLMLNPPSAKYLPFGREYYRDADVFGHLAVSSAGSKVAGTASDQVCSPEGGYLSETTVVARTAAVESNNAVWTMFSGAAGKERGMSVSFAGNLILANGQSRVAAWGNAPTGRQSEYFVVPNGFRFSQVSTLNGTTTIKEATWTFPAMLLEESVPDSTASARTDSRHALNYNPRMYVGFLDEVPQANNTVILPPTCRTVNSLLLTCVIRGTKTDELARLLRSSSSIDADVVAVSPCPLEPLKGEVGYKALPPVTSENWGYVRYNGRVTSLVTEPSSDCVFYLWIVDPKGATYGGYTTYGGDAAGNSSYFTASLTAPPGYLLTVPNAATDIQVFSAGEADTTLGTAVEAEMTTMLSSTAEPEGMLPCIKWDSNSDINKWVNLTQPFADHNGELRATGNAVNSSGNSVGSIGFDFVSAIGKAVPPHVWAQVRQYIAKVLGISVKETWIGWVFDWEPTTGLLGLDSKRKAVVWLREMVFNNPAWQASVTKAL